MSVRFIESSWGNPLVYVNEQFTFRRDRGNEDRSTWRCVKKDCRARLTLIKGVAEVSAGAFKPDTID